MRVDRQKSLPSSVKQFDEGCQSGMFQDVAKVADVVELLVESHLGSECRPKATLASSALVIMLMYPWHLFETSPGDGDEGFDV